jgi:hypothetical protein
MRQPDMAFILRQESDHLPEAGGGCSDTPSRNIRILIPCVVGHLPGKLHTIPSDFDSQCDTKFGCTTQIEVFLFMSYDTN